MNDGMQIVRCSSLNHGINGSLTPKECSIHTNLILAVSKRSLGNYVVFSYISNQLLFPFLVAMSFRHIHQILKHIHVILLSIQQVNTLLGFCIIFISFNLNKFLFTQMTNNLQLSRFFVNKKSCHCIFSCTTTHFMGYRPLVAQCLPLADLHYFCVTKVYICIDKTVPGLLDVTRFLLLDVTICYGVQLNNEKLEFK